MLKIVSLSDTTLIAGFPHPGADNLPPARPQQYIFELTQVLVEVKEALGVRRNHVVVGGEGIREPTRTPWESV